MLGGLVALLSGFAFLVFPTTMLGAAGLATPNEALVVSRDIGATLIGLGVINWMARDATALFSSGTLLSKRSSSS
jgi:hypothetical protein